MFTVQKKKVLFLSDFNGRIGGVTVTKGMVVDSNSVSGIDNSVDLNISEDRFTTLQNAIVTFVSTILGKGNEKPEIRMWASEIIPQLSQERQDLVLGIVLRDDDGKINGYSWNGEMKQTLELSLPKYI